ncbi:hypothetical protein BC834DRAFT_110399 [Gloeopeniophorella convolvens]|nr:hypothetical protein BC834DRAFT_110399 [Gloeopeniophorella convolvens]
MPELDGLVFVTGASGFLGAHVLHQLLEADYQVRACVRTAKVSCVEDSWHTYGDQLEVVAVDDLAAADLTEALEGVSAILHVAAPLASAGPPDAIISGAVEGTLNIVRQAYAAGVRKFVVTSTLLTAFDPLNPTSIARIAPDSWNPASLAHAQAGTHGPAYTYAAAKTRAERALWAFADAHPDADVTTLNPSYLGGPFAPGICAPPAPDRAALSTNAHLYQLVLPPARGGAYPRSPPAWTDVRDAARLHVAALRAGVRADGARKRLVLCGAWFAFRDAVEWLRAERPALRGRTVDPADAPPVHEEGWVVDVSLAEEVLGFSREELRPWREMLLDAVDAVLELERGWAAKGLRLDI